MSPIYSLVMSEQWYVMLDWARNDAHFTYYTLIIVLDLASVTDGIALLFRQV